ncbi:hypothetical protein MNBD_BACTEROID05-1251 [hydrothermal vent metagenome]|uniref:Uncharacterized protein n=1 Tax=hydrothermal vent metagenome TaxID=652676 RepID=A0A3B0TAA7_9ZZZZ
MENQLVINSANGLTTDAMLKKTALSYLRDALEKQLYEDCADLIESAKGFGASQTEVSVVIAKAVNKVQLYEAQRNIFKYS